MAKKSWVWVLIDLGINTCKIFVLVKVISGSGPYMEDMDCSSYN